MNAPLLTSWWWDTPGEWTEDGGWNWLYLPGTNYLGYCCWMPTLQGAPNVSHLGPDSFPAEFHAVLTDYCGTTQPTFQWSSSDENIQFSSPHAQTTMATCDSLPSWASLVMSVQANFGGPPLESYLYSTYGTNETPQVALSLSAPELVFLNDDNRTSRWYRVSVGISCEVETNVTVTISHSGSTNARFASDSIGENSITPSQVNLSTSYSERTANYSFYMASANIGDGSFTAECTTPDGDELSAARNYKVIEPLRKLVCTDEAPTGGYYNPSRLVYGTNAWLEVGVNGNYDMTEVEWRIVSGPGRIVSTATTSQTSAACVEATSDTGEVVVEAAFGSDSAEQPQFALPVVHKRRVSVAAYITTVSANGQTPITHQTIERKLTSANRVFSQSGIEFYLLEPPTVLPNSQYAIVREQYQ